MANVEPYVKSCVDECPVYDQGICRYNKSHYNNTLPVKEKRDVEVTKLGKRCKHPQIYSQNSRLISLLKSD